VTDEAKLAFFTSVVTFIFSAGGFYVWVRLRVRDLQRDLAEGVQSCRLQTEARFSECMNDINGVAARDRDNSRDERRHYHNVTMAVLVAAPADKETEITKLLQEQGGEK
jgi:hypothetical protein